VKTISVIGQSNSIGKGLFVDQLKEKTGIRLINAARVGASPSVLAPYMAFSDAFFAGVDYCILDLCIVDRYTLIDRSTNYLCICKWVEWIGHKARRNGCEPIFLLLPIEHAIDELSVLTLYEAIATFNGFFYLDARKLIKTMAAVRDCSTKELYSDDMHVGLDVSTAIADELEKFIATHEKRRYNERIVTVPLKQFEVISFAGLGQNEVNYRSCLMTFSGIRLHKDFVIRISTGEIEHVHAFMINASQSFRKLALDGNVRVIKNVNVRPHISGSAMEARIVPICTPLRDRSGAISISIAGDDEPPTEPSMQQLDIDLDTPAFVEIAGILVETGTQMISYEAFVPSACEAAILEA